MIAKFGKIIIAGLIGAFCAFHKWLTGRGKAEEEVVLEALPVETEEKGAWHFNQILILLGQSANGRLFYLYIKYIQNAWSKYNGPTYMSIKSKNTLTNLKMS